MFIGWTSHWLKNITAGVAIAKWTRTAMESLGIDGWAGEIAEYIDRFNFWIDTRKTSGEKPIKGASGTVAGKEAFTLLKTLIYPKTLRDASIAEIQETILRNVRPAQLELVERAEFHTLGLKD